MVVTNTHRYMPAHHAGSVVRHSLFWDTWSGFIGLKMTNQCIRGLFPPIFNRDCIIRVMMATNEGLGWSRVPHDSIELTTETSAFPRYLLAGFVLKARYDFGKFERSK
jgi:hypothetical protein